MEIDIRIMTVPNITRQENVRRLQQQLQVPDEKIFCDTDYRGCAWNSKRAFTYPSDKSHILVLQDDVQVCDNFIDIVNKIINQHPHSIITLFDYYGIHAGSTPYKTVRNKSLTGHAIIIPQEFISPVFNFTYSPFYATNADDTHIIYAARHFGYEVLLIVPNLVNALPMTSICGTGDKLTSCSFQQDVSGIN